MNQRQNPQITRPSKNIQITKGSEVLTPQPKVMPFSPLFFLQPNSPMSPSCGPSTLLPRAPIVHLFISDHGNAKVKTLAEQFLNSLLENGINVYVEQYVTHQPGFQVRAASLSSFADFFFQIYSKTAGSGHVRLFQSGQPSRMTIEEAVVQIWAIWRFKNAALSPEEVDLLSNDKVTFLLNEYAKIKPQDIDIASIQTTAQEVIENGVSVRPTIEKLSKIDTMLQDGKAKILSSQTMGYEFNKQKGKLLKQMTSEQSIPGISQPLKDALVSIIEHTLNKVKAIIGILEKHDTSPQLESYSTHDNIYQLSSGTSDPDQKSRDGSSWKDMIESLDEHVESMKIPSYDDGTLGDSMNTPYLLLDDY